jgi:hypothetical protein
MTGCDRSMTEAELKKEYRKLCRTEKSKSYRYHRICYIILIVIILYEAFIFSLDNFTSIFQSLYPLQIFFYLGCLPFAVVGIVFDLLGDRAFKQGFREYLKEKQQT